MTPILGPPLIVAEQALPQRHQTGSAQMEQDGTIILRFRVAAGANLGEGEMRYAPGTADYEQVRKHLPSLAPGKSVPVYNDWH